jgi:hypothetical protein
MPDCGSEHGRICAAQEQHDEDIKSIWSILSRKLTIQVFTWACVVVGVALSLIVGWLGASNGKLQDVYARQQVVVERLGNVQQQVERNREIVTEQYVSIKESIKDLKRSFKHGDTE